MPWSEQLEVGIAEIDQQHRWLVDTTTLHRLPARKRPAQINWGILSN